MCQTENQKREKCNRDHLKVLQWDKQYYSAGLYYAVLKRFDTVLYPSISAEK